MLRFITPIFLLILFIFTLPFDMKKQKDLRLCCSVILLMLMQMMLMLMQRVRKKMDDEGGS